MSYFRDLRNNLSIFQRAATFRAIKPSLVVANAPQIVTSFAAMMFVYLASAAYQVWPVGGLSYYDLTLVFGFWFWMIVILTVAPILFFSQNLVAPILVLMPLAFALVSVLLVIVGVLTVSGPLAGPAGATILALGALLPILGTTARLLRRNFFFGFLLSIPLIGTLALGQIVLIGGMQYMPEPFYSAEVADEDEDESWSRIDVESLYYAQPALMERAVSGLAAQRPGETDIYALVFGGTASQGVFLSEVEKGAAILAETHDAGARTIQLANSRVAPERFPLANRRNLAASLAAIGESMDAEEDIAFLYLSSHGSKERLSLSFWEAGIGDLTPGELSEMLAASGIRNAVIVISACYSGSFIDDLQSPDRLIITASSAERQSFGCADKNEWTWWGSAYFEHGLKESPDFRRAFEHASRTVTEWEGEAGYKHSEPQMHIGAEIAVLLDALSESRENPATLRAQAN